MQNQYLFYCTFEDCM